MLEDQVMGAWLVESDIYICYWVLSFTKVTFKDNSAKLLQKEHGGSGLLKNLSYLV